MEISAVGSRARQEEDEALQKDESTSAIMNKVRKDAHCGTKDVELHGNDKTRREVSDEFKGSIDGHGAAELGKTAFEGLDVAGLGLEGAVGAAGLAAGAVGGLFLYGAHVIELEKQKAELQEAVIKDELHVSVLTQLDVPPGFKAIEIGRRSDAGRSFQSDTQKMATPLATKDKALVAVLQLHADRGMNAALDAIASGTSKEKFLSANPKIAELYKNDAAFRDGFDAVLWAKDRSPSELEAAKQGLKDRDARFQSAHVSVRA